MEKELDAEQACGDTQEQAILMLLMVAEGSDDNMFAKVCSLLGFTLGLLIRLVLVWQTTNRAPPSLSITRELLPCY